jgi:hypothetical protein
MKTEVKLRVPLKNFEHPKVNEEYFYRHLAQTMIEGMDLEELKKMITFKIEDLKNTDEIEYTAVVILP